MTQPRPSRRAGFTLVEVLVAMTIFGTVLAVTLSTLNEQVKAFFNGASQLDAAQYLRFAMNELEKDLPVTGSNVPPDQPFLIYADTNVVAINGDYMSNLANDAFAVYVDTTMPTNLVTAVGTANRFTIPMTAVQYPDTTYTGSPAETLIFYFQRDTSTSDPDDYVLWRQVNDQAGEMVARNIRRSQAAPFFRYLKTIPNSSGQARIDTVPLSALPLRHTTPIHGSALDTVPSARIDSIRAIQITMQATDDRPAAARRTFEMRRTISLPNAGKVLKKTCGDEPLLGTFTFTATPALVSGVPRVQLDWTAAVDETAGERDVVRYVLWKGLTAPTAADNPFLSIPSGNTTYSFTDTQVTSGGTYYYAIAAQDCTPSISTLRTQTAIVP